MSTIVDARIRALSADLELLASTTLPSLFAPRLGLAPAPAAAADGDMPPTPAEDADDDVVVAATEPVLAALDRLLVRPGGSLPSIKTLEATLRAYLAHQSGSDESATADPAKQVEWLLVAAGAVVLYGRLLDTLLNQTLPLAEDIFYWDNVLSGPRGLVVYSIQTAPVRFVGLAHEIWTDARRRLTTPRPSLADWITTLRAALSRHRKTTRRLSALTRAVAPTTALFKRAMSPLSTVYKDVQSKQQQLRHLRDTQSAALGLLVGESVQLGRDTDWRRTVERTVDVMAAIVAGVSESDQSVDRFEARVFAVLSASSSSTPSAVAHKIVKITTDALPAQTARHAAVVAVAGKPSALTRYWPVGVGAAAFSGTVLRILFNRRASIGQWLADASATAVDFWHNWVVEPARNIIATIRHDDSAQVAIVGRKSLEADMQSLERMVVDFAVDNAATTTGAAALSAADVDAIRAGVREGDVSAVLRVYEDELKAPLKNAVRGELIRTLLIQMQKTKVDVEVAITGIDRLLKSQELVFGVVAALPSSVACYVAAGYTRRLWSGKGVRTRADLKATVVRTLGNVERILTTSTTTSGTGGESEWLTYTDEGRVLCEVHVLRNSPDVIPRELRRDWARDLGDLEDIRLGVRRQRLTVERIWRVYGRFFV
ncbi:ATP synthase regulation protein NCA2-domain-containing protein [Lipomyces tetrasporus]|uniref:ATP synthase regulation protein NCA2-domain-containing protein n=1 Tax=Lipomyces tetrasporus TaxID=54092 RepID=A0AAD7VRR6_9ASCO|nr:ATP synthase regulation protein NCA2-domain-containing protein [Lipomyces tetrasporus]KAJ8099473.1 ATP synthase regulation protein NCA2-domain-containing protein [Lipomyces tetrasporus]